MRFKIEDQIMRLKINDLRIKKTKLVVLLVILFIFHSLIVNPKSIYAQASPQQSISVSPIINDLQLIPGKKTAFKITIQNNNTTAIGIHSEITGYDVTGETSNFEQKESAMTQWTTLSQSDLLINGKQSKTINVTIDTPINIGQSGYYETIFLTPIFHQQQTANSPIILSRFGILVLGTVGKLNYNDLSKKVSVTDLSPSHTILNTFPDTFSFTVANNYFTHFDAKPFITITPLFAKSQTTLLTDKHVLPGSARVWQYQLATQSNHIFYNVHLAVSVGGGKQIYADTFFIVLPYVKILIILAILILLYIGTIGRKRLKKFVTILLKG
jgi:hypothetical protein